MSDVQAEAPLGPRFVPGGVEFSLWAPEATQIELLLVTNHPQPTLLAMQREADGVWRLHVPGVTAGQLYGFRVDGP